jgi:hypothetical protein
MSPGRAMRPLMIAMVELPERTPLTRTSDTHARNAGVATGLIGVAVIAGDSGIGAVCNSVGGGGNGAMGTGAGVTLGTTGGRTGAATGSGSLAGNKKKYPPAPAISSSTRIPNKIIVFPERFAGVFALYGAGTTTGGALTGGGSGSGGGKVTAEGSGGGAGGWTTGNTGIIPGGATGKGRGGGTTAAFIGANGIATGVATSPPDWGLSLSRGISDAPSSGVVAPIATAGGGIDAGTAAGVANTSGVAADADGIGSGSAESLGFNRKRNGATSAVFSTGAGAGAGGWTAGASVSTGAAGGAGGTTTCSSSRLRGRKRN